MTDVQSAGTFEDPFGYCPNHRTGVTLPADFAVTPLQYVDRVRSAATRAGPTYSRAMTVLRMDNVLLVVDDLEAA